MEAGNFSPPCDSHVNSSPDLDMDPHFRLKSSEIESHSATAGGDSKFR